MSDSNPINSSDIKSLQQIISYIPDIVRRERNNQQYIYLYNVGHYWAAFDESAFLLCKLFNTTQTAIFRNTGYPFPVIMGYISHEELQKYNRHHIFCRDYPDHKVIIGSKIITEQYRNWYRMEIEDC